MNSSVEVYPDIGVLLTQEHPLATNSQEQRLFASVPAGGAMGIEMTDQFHGERLYIPMLKSDFRQWVTAVLAMLDEKVDTHTVDGDRDSTYGNPGPGPFRPEGPY